MKKMFLTYSFFLYAFSFGQNPIIPIESLDGSTPPIGAYLKDTNNSQILYIGTWRYAENGKELAIVLRRYTRVNLGSIYQDILIGEYKYAENGVTIVNTLANLDFDLPNKWNHNIRGGTPINNASFPLCLDCEPQEKRMVLGLRDPIREASGKLTLRRININGNPAIHMILYGNGETYKIDDPNVNKENFNLRVNISECVLLKID
ncbi:hypothetical protein GV828_05100 [Flavobacterium sp. NST-5]|uniref:DUF6705 domain-containing protein n=1 Tax=Flavobacterium ichthyis TaxID=2698827 RepID=A0ABW9Z7A0_9FLAO|nr:DUF6705 family protein [Flavobacterium ichthyis]NBL64576.1 hypothetical protein [Flavobacterium ichthyis]